MISVQQADRIIQKNLKRYKSVTVHVQEAVGRIIHQDLKADRHLPPYDKSLMDGIAINLTAYQRGQRNFKIEGTQAAGYAALKLKSKSNCFEIMTGAMLPVGCDVVIPIEKVNIAGQVAIVNNGLTLTKWQHVRRCGADHRKGETLLSGGTRLFPPQIATAAAIGAAKIKVSPKLKIAIITSGDELTDIDQPVKPFQVRQSNSIFIQAALNRTGLFDSSIFHFPDNEKELQSGIGKILRSFDALVLSGGVSMGKFDFIPKVLTQLGVNVLFHKVEQKPGKPFWFGLSKKKQPVFALPGNPVSTQVGVYRYVIPHLAKALGQKDRVIASEAKQSKRLRLLRPKSSLAMTNKTISLAHEVTPSPNLTLFLPVIFSYNNQGLMTAKVHVTGGSGDFGSLANTEGFIEVACGTKIIKQGIAVPFYSWKL